MWRVTEKCSLKVQYKSGSSTETVCVHASLCVCVCSPVRKEQGKQNERDWKEEENKTKKLASWKKNRNKDTD